MSRNVFVLGRRPARPVGQTFERDRALADIERLKRLPRAGLGSWPTPLERHSLHALPSLWIKRDDLSAFGRGGAKARKLDLILGHMLQHGYDELITLAGNVTNLAFDLLPALDRHGLRASLYIVDDPPVAAEQRAHIFGGIRERIRLITGSRLEASAKLSAAWLAGKAAGRRPFLLLPGAAHPTGVLGNALGYLEMVEQLEAMGEARPAAVFVTAATGTTVAGFALAETLLRSAGRGGTTVIGVQAYGGATRAQTLGLMRWARRRYALAAPTSADDVHIDRTALAGGFGRFTRAQIAACERAARQCGVQLDPIFGGKTWSVLEQRASEHPRASVLFWHCGFTPEWALLGAAVNRS